MRNDSSDNNPRGVVILENSPVGESQFNGLVEVAIKDVEEQVATMV